MRRSVVVLVAFAVIAFCARSQAAPIITPIIISFNNGTIDGGFNVGSAAFQSVPVLGLVSQGFSIVPSNANGLVVDSGFASMSFGNGSPFLTWNQNLVSSGSITVSRASAFNLDSLLLGTLKPFSNAATYTLFAAGPGTVGGAANGPTPGPLGFTNLTSFVLSWTGGDALAIDNITLSNYVEGPAPAAVPEPASVLLLGLGACVMGARRLRRRNTVIA